MKRRRLSLPEIALIAGTRVALGAGAGFLMSDRLNDGTRKGAGWALLLIGALSTIPIAAGLFSKNTGIAGRLGLST